MSAFDGIDAYSAYMKGTYLTASETQPSTSWERQAMIASVFRVVEDKVTLSSDAQAFLNQKARSGIGAEGASLRGADVHPTNLIGADLAGKDFSGADLTRAFLYRANLVDADFSKATLKDAWISDSDVAGANFNGADLRGANLAKARNLTRDQLKLALVDLDTILPVTVRLEK